MISHEHKVIFVHIPRTAGTSIEKWIQDEDQWLKNPREKHLTAIEMKETYSEFWSDYWKFTILRNPVDRFISMLKFKDHFGVTVNGNGELDISGYLQKFCANQGIVIEHDHRFTNISSLNDLALQSGFSYQKGAIYKNMIGNEIDMVFDYERLDQATHYLSQKLGLNPADFPHSEKSILDQQSSPIITEETRCIIDELHSLDLDLFFNGD